MYDARPLRAKSPRSRDTEGELLKDHSLATLHRSNTVNARIGRIAVLPQRFAAWLSASGLLHDPGKAAHGHQRQIGNTSEPAQVWGERHEVLSLGFLPTVLSALPRAEILWIAAGVVTHHRPITGNGGRRPSLLPLYGRDTAEDFTKKFGPINADAVQDLAIWLHATAIKAGLIPRGPRPALTPEILIRDAHTLFGELLEQWEWARSPEDEADGLTAVLLQGGVTMADRMASAHTSVHRNHPLTPEYQERLERRLTAKGFQLRPHQTEAAATSGHIFIRAWTGSGKTEAALLWALRNLQEMTDAGQGTPRIFYLLPYLAAINAMVRRLENDLQAKDQIGVSHSHAASYYLARALEDECATDAEALAAARKSLAQENATRLFRELIRVGTPYQPLRGTLAGPGHSSVLLDTANSLFILDELHAYDPQRLGMILAMMSFWEHIGGRFAIVSATLPDALQEAIRTALARDVHLIEPPEGTVFPRRHRLSVRRHPLGSDAALTEMTGRLEAGEALLVVANNRPTARALYRQLGSISRRIHGGDTDAAIMLHSRYRRDHRAAIEDRIRDRYKNGHKDRKGGILVATQTVEVSLDVDFDSIHTACAPMDALCQRFGRVNRSGSRPPADVIVHAPQYMPRSDEPGLFADGVYPKTPVALAWNILQRHHEEVIDEALSTTWLNEIYADTAGSWGKEWRAELELSKERFSEAFLTWTEPFRDRSELKDDFDAMFDGKEAVLKADRDEYARRLATDNGQRPGRLLAEDLLIPIAGKTATTWDDKLKVNVIDAEYDPENGLGRVHQ
ncbi:CRISPR-associated helicase Cas3' [Streptomyces sp. NPDC050804]|uniref:CRISPR-associated helicase Cas3' n=1 Tax=unclassified Streptomyces TaxID=2593676 RepID=UPI0034191796|nr:CRISPR-associated helicase Cas3' [Streptomyces sp. NBC_00872]